MIPRAHHNVAIQGMTGKQGSYWTEQMIACGTNVISGVNPRRAGETHLGLPVYGSVCEAANDKPVDISVMFVPPLAAKNAAIDACEAGVKLLVCLAEHIPSQDVMEMHAAARANNTRIVGPNTAGLVTPGECFVGIMPGFNKTVFQPGRIGVISRSGSLGTLLCLNLSQQGMGQSVFYGVGGDPMLGTTSRDALEILNADANTDVIVLCGEIGGSAEEEAAEFASTMTKKVVAFIAGRQSPPGKKMGHAGAIVTWGKGDYDSKRKALEAAGVFVADVPSQVPTIIKDIAANTH